MPVVPDDIWFACAPPETWTPENSSVSFGEVRALPIDRKRLALKRRLDEIMVGQIQGVRKLLNADGKPLVPQALVTLTCVAIGTMGTIFHEQLRTDGTHMDREEFLAMAEDIDPNFAQPWAEAANSALAATMGKKAHLTHALTLYKALRCGFIHSYKTSGAFLGNVETDAWSVNATPYYLIISPAGLWELVSTKYEAIWQAVLSNPTDKRGLSMNSYLQSLLG